MKVEITKRAQKDLLHMDQKTCTRILDALAGLEREPPEGDLKKLKTETKNHWRLRVGDYRAIFRTDTEKQTIFILHIGHRGEVYR